MWRRVVKCPNVDVFHIQVQVCVSIIVLNICLHPLHTDVSGP